jgi:prepilin-type N-terminal cleavage/methylation domain-containing protein
MGIFGKKQGKTGGFTIIELLVVISVIGILAGIVAFAFPTYQQHTRDSQRKSDLSQLAAALNAYALQKNDFVGSSSGCGFLGQGNGWFDYGPDAYFPKSINSCLKDAGVLKTDFIDPSKCLNDSGGKCGTSGNAPTTAYMKATCTKNGAPITYLFAYLEGQPRQDSTIDALCDAGSVAGFDASTQKWGTNYGMNYYVIVK